MATMAGAGSNPFMRRYRPPPSPMYAGSAPAGAAFQPASASLPTGAVPALGTAAGSDAAEGAIASHYAGYDPSAAIGKYADGLWQQTQEGYRKNLDQLATSSNAAGRLDTGYFDADQGQLYRDTVNDYGHQLAQTAVQAEGMKEDAYGNYANLVAARREERINAEREKAQQKRAKRRGILGTLGTLGGATIGGLLGGLPGAKAGASFGGSLAGAG